MLVPQSRIFFILAVISCGIIILPYPGTTFMAFCASCLLLPLYRQLKLKSLKKIRTLPSQSKLRRKLLHSYPIVAYVSTILAFIIIPTVIFVLLVAPQASRGIEQLKTMDLSEKLKVLLPENIKSFINAHLPSLNDYPHLSNIADELTTNINNFFNTGGDLFNPILLWHRAVGLLGGTMSLLWVLCLFIILTVLFTIYARAAKYITCEIFAMPYDLLSRLIDAIRRALKAIVLGIVLVALIQGIFCGVGFAIAGIESPAFWGLLATFVAPIPVVGTMLVWGPLALLQWFTGSHFAAVGLTLWGLLVVSNIDSICRPMFLRHGIQAPFVVLIIVIVCGLNTFGPIGLIAAPVLLAFGLALLREGQRQQLLRKNSNKQ
ncbi:MAG: AI-2E family transporter [Desulfovibrionaceae bacterium]|nr:AI-2E family transporter [Desulfovibrionaceae bacterium]